MSAAVFNTPFVQIALPLLIGMFLTAWAAITTNNKRFEDMGKRFDDMNHRFDDVFRRLDSIDGTLKDHGTRLTRIEERTSLVRI